MKRDIEKRCKKLGFFTYIFMYLLIAIFLHHSQAVLFKLRTIVIEVEFYEVDLRSSPVKPLGNILK